MVRLNRFAGILRQQESPCNDWQATACKMFSDWKNNCKIISCVTCRTWKKRLDYLSRSLKTVGPLATLERGYAIVTDEDDNIVRRADQLRENAEIKTRFSKGSVRSTVNAINTDEK